MAISDDNYRLRYWPNLVFGSYFEVSDFDEKYNCIAFAADETQRWWEPVLYWPTGAVPEYTVAAYATAFETKGYKPCGLDSSLEHRFEKVAIYAIGNRPTHAAKQLPDGRWKSKLGEEEDIEHDSLSNLESDLVDGYGRIVLIMKREARRSILHEIFSFLLRSIKRKNPDD